MTARRIVSVWLLRFPIQRWRRRSFGPQAAEEDEPLVLSFQGPHGPVIHDLNEAAVREGLSRGGPVTVADIEARLALLQAKGLLLGDGDRMVTTQGSVRLEQAYLAAVEAGKGQSAPIVPPAISRDAVW